MVRGKRQQPESINRKRKRRAPQSLEEIERRRGVKFTDVEEGTSPKGHKTVKRKKKTTFKKVIKGIGIAVAIIIIFLLFSVVKFFMKIDNSDVAGAVSPKGDSVNILVLGMDIGDVKQVNNDSIKRTDTIMLVNYNKSTKTTQILSIPRDTLVDEKGGIYKINAAYQKGGEAKVKSVIEKMLSTTINYVVKINYNAFRSFMDAIGGVDMNIERDMIYDDDGQNLHINFKGGTTVHLDGKKSEEFFRWRKNNDGTGFANGDLDRIKNQHLFLEKVVEKCKSPTIIFKIPKILNSVAENMETNMSSLNMINYGLKILLSASDIKMVTLQGTPKMIGGQSYLVFDKNSNKDIISSLSSGIASTTLTKGDVKILVLNGTKISGLAARVKTELEVLGWSKIDTGNVGSLYDKSIIETDSNDIKKLLTSDLPEITKSDKKPTDDKYASYDAVIVIGSDYKKLGE